MFGVRTNGAASHEVAPAGLHSVGRRLPGICQTFLIWTCRPEQSKLLPIP